MAEVRATRTLPPWIDSYSPRLGTPHSARSGESHASPPRSSPVQASPAVPAVPAAAVQPQHNSQPVEPKRRPPRGSHSSGTPSNAVSNISGRSRQISSSRRQPSPDGYEDPSPEKLPLKKRRPRNLKQFFSGKGPSQWDHLRTADPVIVPNRAPESQQSWRDFVVSSRYGQRNPNEHAEIVDDEVLDNLQPGLNKPVSLPGGIGGPGDLTKPGNRTSRLRQRARPPPFFERILLAPVRHPLGPLFCRLTVLSTSIIALALSASIVQKTMSSSVKERGQAIFAVAVDTVAIPYIGYIMWDENLGPPLVGMQRTKERVKLILMDLFFIMFKAASTGLAFETLIFTDLTSTRPLLEALTAFELLGLVSWAMTLIANVFRVVERLGGRGDNPIGFQNSGRMVNGD